MTTATIIILIIVIFLIIIGGMLSNTGNMNTWETLWTVYNNRLLQEKELTLKIEEELTKQIQEETLKAKIEHSFYKIDLDKNSEEPE